MYSDTFVDAQCNSLDGMPKIEITMVFIEHEGKTKVVTRNQFATEETLKQIVEMGCNLRNCFPIQPPDQLLAGLQ